MDTGVAEIVAAMGHTAGTLRINSLSYAAKKLIAPSLGGFHHEKIMRDNDPYIANGDMRGMPAIYNHAGTMTRSLAWLFVEHK
jgi:hypothetical protein